MFCHFSASEDALRLREQNSGSPACRKTPVSSWRSSAEGVQIYESKPNSSGAYEWTLKAPEAELKSLAGEVIGKHYGGPSWSLNDGSQLVGSLPPLKAVSAPEGRKYPLVVSGGQVQVRSRVFEQNRLCGPDRDLGRRRSRGNAQKLRRIPPE